MKKVINCRSALCNLTLLSIGVVLLIVISGCRTRHAVASEISTSVSDNNSQSTNASNHVMKRITNRLAEPDTVVCVLSSQYAEKIVKDSISEIENDYAVSRVELYPDGTFSHILDSRNRKIALPITKYEEQTDSISTYNTSRLSMQNGKTLFVQENDIQHELPGNVWIWFSVVAVFVLAGLGFMRKRK